MNYEQTLSAGTGSVVLLNRLVQAHAAQGDYARATVSWRRSGTCIQTTPRPTATSCVSWLGRESGRGIGHPRSGHEKGVK